MSTLVDALFLVNLATVLNKYQGLCLFSSKREEKKSDLAVFNYYTSSFVFLQLRFIFWASLFRVRVKCRGFGNCTIWIGVKCSRQLVRTELDDS